MRRHRTDNLHRYGEGFPTASQRNAPLTNAERQKRYRDKKRGGPPLGRWPAGYMSLSDYASLIGVSRSSLVKLQYLEVAVPDWADALAEPDRPVSLTRAYYLVRLQRNMAILQLLQAGDRSGEGLEVAVRFRKSDSSFTAYWRKAKREPAPTSK